MSSNRINTHFTAEQREEAKAALAALAASLPFLIDLSPDERAAMPRFGDKSRGFISKALDIAENNPDILPRSFSLDEFRADVEIVENLYAIRNGIDTLLGRVNDTWFAAGSEAYAAALLIYQYAKIHNVASGVFRSATELSSRHLKWTFDVNARSLLTLVGGFVAERPDAPPLLPAGSAIVAISSLGAVRAIPQYAALGASKAALESIARHLALELGPHDIRVNVVSPGIVQTRALAHLPHRDQLLDIAARRTPLARLCTPNDVAEVVAFLGSPAAAMIHGQTLHVDYGITIPKIG